MVGALAVVLVAGQIPAAAADPVARADAYSTPVSTVLDVPAPGVLANDTDSDPGDTLTSQMPTRPSHGTVVLRLNGSFTYTPTGYSGPDSFTYMGHDRTRAMSLAIVRITVGSVPPRPPSR